MSAGSNGIQHQLLALAEAWPIFLLVRTTGTTHTLSYLIKLYLNFSLITGQTFAW